MKLTFEEKKLLYTYGCADLELNTQAAVRDRRADG